jgi:hypothetical protein
VRGGGEAAHVDPDLGEDHLRGPSPHPRDRDQPLELLTERADHPVNLDVESRDVGRELVDVIDVVIEVQAQHQRVAVHPRWPPWRWPPPA